jgi:hypothetical protein
MAGSTRYAAILDANTLYPAPLRDLLLSLAVHKRVSREVDRLHPSPGLFAAMLRIHSAWLTSSKVRQ